MASIIPTRFLVMSDTHGFDVDLESDGVNFPLRLPTPRVDVLLHCGDLTQVGGIPEFRKALHMLSKVDAELKLVIAGNHDLELDAAFDPDELEDHEEAMALWTGPKAKAAGVTFLTEGTYTFALSNGSHFTIYASPYQPEFGDWAFGYKHTEDRFNRADQIISGTTSIATSPVPDRVDIMMTHGPPRGILDRDKCGDTHLGCDNLLQAAHRARPLLHCFGHIHEGYGVQAMSWTDHEDDNISPTDVVPLDEAEDYGSTNHTTQATILAERPSKTSSTARSVRASQMNVPKSLRAFDILPGECTLMINAALQTGPSEWHNAPWLIDLPLSLRY